jgi:glycosyltransferase involved in cell wall biosynthesis
MNPHTLLVVMPVYNSEKTLDNAIKSILDQTYENFVLFIVDDNSSDKSFEIAQKYTNDRRVVVHKNKINLGAYYCRNLGLYLNKDLSWGYFTTHDSDDISYPDRFAKMIRVLRSRQIRGVQDMFERKRIDTNISLGAKITMAHAMFKKEVFNEIGYFETVRFGADWEYWARFLLKNKIINKRHVTIKEVLGESFVHENNLTIQVPVGSAKRKKYVGISKEKHKEMSKNNNFYIKFNPKDYG